MVIQLRWRALQCIYRASHSFITKHQNDIDRIFTPRSFTGVMKETNGGNKTMADKYLTLTSVKDMGFTKKLIDDLLPEPILKTNPHYKKAAPMKLWKEEDILKAMESEQFKLSLAGREKRKSAAKKGLVTKKQNLIELAREMAELISVDVINDDELVKRTLSAKSEWYQEQRDRYWSLDYHNPEWEYMWYYDVEGEIYLNKSTIDKSTLDRWIVNYIRHNLTIYDAKLRRFSRKYGKEEAYEIFKKCVLGKIAEVYPKYADECYSQMEFVISH